MVLAASNNLCSASVSEGEIKKLVIVICCCLLHVCYELLKVFRQKIHSTNDFNVNFVAVNAFVSEQFAEFLFSNPHDFLNFDRWAMEVFGGKRVERYKFDVKHLKPIK